MSGGFPWIITALAGTLLLVIAIAVFFVRNRQPSAEKIFDRIHKKTFLALSALGMICSLGGAFLMFNGKVLGENTVGIAEIIGIIGICLIASASSVGAAVKKKTTAQ